MNYLTQFFFLSWLSLHVFAVNRKSNFINFRTFPLFTAPVYENEQTAIESYDAGEFKYIKLRIFCFNDNEYISISEFTATRGSS